MAAHALEYGKYGQYVQTIQYNLYDLQMTGNITKCINMKNLPTGKKKI